MIAISFTMAVIPAVLLVVYFYRKDRLKPEPKELITKTFFLGVLSIVPAIILELMLQLWFSALASYPYVFAFIRAFIVAALVEELLKFTVVRFYVYKKEAFDEVMDGIVYTVVAGLGFACLENIMYVMKTNMFVAVVRAFTAVPMHAFAAGIMGYYIGKARFAGSKSEEGGFIRKGILLAVLIHGLYDFLLFVMPITARSFGSYVAIGIGLLNVPLLIWAFVHIKKKMRLAIEEDIKEGRH